MNKVKEFVSANWRDRLALQGLIGIALESDLEWNFGSAPTEKASVETQDGVIVRVSTWSGQFWTVRGYGAPIVIAE